MFFFLDRARATLRDIGPAVWNGGFSTFLAIVLLAFSNSYVFKTFFKVSRDVTSMGSSCWIIWMVDTVLLWLQGGMKYMFHEHRKTTFFFFS